MITTGVKTVPDLSLRWMVERDLPWVLYIEQETPFLNWARQDYLHAFQSNDIVCMVAESRDLVVGFMVFGVQLQTDVPEGRARKYLGAGPHHEPLDVITQPTHYSLRHLAVASKWQRRGVGRALLKHLDQRLRHPDDFVQVRVPESRLPIQLLLRSAGYRALRVLRGYYGNEDAFLLERRWS